MAKGKSRNQNKTSLFYFRRQVFNLSDVRISIRVTFRIKMRKRNPRGVVLVGNKEEKVRKRIIQNDRLFLFLTLLPPFIFFHLLLHTIPTVIFSFSVLATELRWRQILIVTARNGFCETILLNRQF